MLTTDGITTSTNRVYSVSIAFSAGRSAALSFGPVAGVNLPDPFPGNRSATSRATRTTAASASRTSTVRKIDLRIRRGATLGRAGSHDDTARAPTARWRG